MPEGLEEKRASSERKYSRYDNYTTIDITTASAFDPGDCRRSWVWIRDCAFVKVRITL